MNRSAPRSIEEYLIQLRAALEGEDRALIQDALYDAEEYLRAEVAAHPGKSEADVLELIASTYGAPDEVAAAYRDTEVKVKAALRNPRPRAPENTSGLRGFFSIYSDPRAYTSFFYMLLALALGILYFVLVVVGISMSAGLAILIIGIPFFLAFIGITRAISLGEGRLIEAVTGERMPRRPVHAGAPTTWGARIGAALKNARTWTTLLYMVLMLPLGIIYFVLATLFLSGGLNLAMAPFLWLGYAFDVFPDSWWGLPPFVLPYNMGTGFWTGFASLVMFIVGVLILTMGLHLARGLVRVHARLAKALLVEPA
jgi:uncharacterized membrane protein